MRVAALVLLALVGCYDDAPGARLVIKDPGFGAHKVELFIATRSSPASAIGADKARDNEERDKLRGDSFFLDGPGDGTTPITELPIVDGQVVWNLQADPERPAKAKLVVAVAYDVEGQAIAIAKMHDLQIPTNDAVAYVLQLEAATQVAPSETMDPPGVRVWPWRKMSAPTTAACLGIEYSDGADHLERLWLVPEDDPDCDEAAIECDEHLYQADYSNQAIACVVPAQMSGTTQTPCRLGQKVCEDDVSSGECVPLSNPTYCLAAALCDPEECLVDTNVCQNVNTSKVTCDMTMQPDGTVCESTSMGAGPLAVELSASSGLFPGGCQAVQLAEANGAGGFTPTPTLMMGQTTFSIEQLSTLECSFSIEVSGQFDLNMVQNNQPLLLVLDVTRGGAHYLVPVFVRVNAGETCDIRSPMCTTTRGSSIDLGLCQ